MTLNSSFQQVFQLIIMLTIVFNCFVSSSMCIARTHSSGNQTMHMKLAKFYDQHGFGRPIVYRTMMLPADWKTYGGVQWDPQNLTRPFTESFAAVSGNGHASLEMLPSYVWTWNNDPYTRQLQAATGMVVAPPLNAYGVVEQYIIPNYRSDAKIVDYKQAPEVCEQMNRQLQQQGIYGQYDMIEVKLSYNQNGVDYYETATVLLSAMHLNSDGTTVFSASNLYLAKAPASQWDAYLPVFETAMKSMRQNGAWTKAIGQFTQRMAQIRQQGIRDRNQSFQQSQQSLAQTYNDILESGQQSWERQQASSDYIQRETNEWIRDVETYTDPSSEHNIEVPSGYEHVYSNGLGEYMMTNDHLFNPNSVLTTGEWTELNPALSH